MIVKTLYRYEREDGGVTVSVEKPETEYTILHRIIADVGKLLINGDRVTKCIDTDSLDGWTEIDDPSNRKTSM